MLDEAYPILQDFLTLLKQKKTALPLDALNQLQQQLNQIGDDLLEIAEVIQDWCDQYPAIAEIFKETDWVKIRGDMADEGEEIPGTDPTATADRVINKSTVTTAINDYINSPPSQTSQPHQTHD